MASITRYSNGRKMIQFIAADGKRRSLRLGKASLRDAAFIKTKVERLVSSTISGHATDDETTRWVAKLDSVMAEKLVAVNLILKRETATLKAFIDAYIVGRTDVKPRTTMLYRQTQANLIEFFGPDKPLRDITVGDADDWRLFLVKKLPSDNTVRRRCGRAKQFFTAAIRRKLISSNPFVDLKSAVHANAERFYYVTRDEADKVLEACPDAEWRLIFALSRYGGLRCPSEHLSLQWGDVDWERGRMRVRSPKTEHHVGGESRVIPIFPELKPHLEAVFDEAEEGSKYVIARYRGTSGNLRTQLNRIIQHAGLKPWPKPFQNLRSSRETELAEKFPMHVICGWIGNSQLVAMKHYLQITDEHFERAVKGAAESDAQALQNPVQQPAALSRTESLEQQNTSGNADVLRVCAKGRDAVRMKQAPRLGLEPRTLRLTAARSTN